MAEEQKQIKLTENILMPAEGSRVGVHTPMGTVLILDKKTAYEIVSSNRAVFS
jgi:hypothetical protein